MLSRRYIERRLEKRGYWNPGNGRMYVEGEGLLQTTSPDLVDMVMLATMHECQVVYLMPSRGKWKDSRGQYPGLADWQKSGLDVSNYYSRNHSATIRLAGGEFEIDIIPVGVWFGSVTEDTYMSDVIRSMGYLKDLLTKHFQPLEVQKGKHDEYRVELLSTPARTGMDLLRRKLPYGAKYEDLPEDVEHLLMSNFGQARFELFDHGDDQVDQVYNYDGLWMYASCCRHMPVGRVVHDFEDKYEKYVSGFYHVEATIPADWSHIGILPVRNPTKGKGSIFPHRAGTLFQSWASHRQVQLALDNGWKITILERILWPDSQAKGMKIGQDPLRYWQEALVKLRQEVANQYEEPIRSFLRDAFRNLLNMTIGCMYRTGKDVDIYVDDFFGDAETPEGAWLEDVDEIAGIRHYQKREELNQYQREGFKPHWAISVWKNAEWKITKEALGIPYNDLIALRADGIWTSNPVDLPNTGKPGCFREKELVNRGPFRWPKTDQDIKLLIRKSRGENG